MMSALPLPILIVAWLLVALVVWLAWLFLTDPDRGLAFTQHQAALLPRVMVDRFFVFFMFMGGALVSGAPGWIAYAFLVTGCAALWNALIYRKAGLPYKKHLVTTALSAIVVAGALVQLNKTGAA